MGEFCERRATVLEVFELDRVLLLFVSGSNTWRNECRLVDVSVEVDVRDGARRWLRAWLLDQKVWVECGKCDGYGRILGVLYMDADFATSVNAHAGARYGREGTGAQAGVYETTSGTRPSSASKTSAVMNLDSRWLHRSHVALRR